MEMNVQVTRHETVGCSCVPRDRVQEGAGTVLNAVMKLQIL
jgi:hypothetical protein